MNSFNLLKKLEFIYKDFDHEFLLKIKHLKGTLLYDDIINFKSNYEKREHLFYTIILIVVNLIVSICIIISESFINLCLSLLLIPILCVYFKFKIKKFFIYYYINNKIKNNPELLI